MAHAQEDVFMALVLRRGKDAIFHHHYNCRRWRQTSQLQLIGSDWSGDPGIPEGIVHSGKYYHMMNCTLWHALTVACSGLLGLEEALHWVLVVFWTLVSLGAEDYQPALLPPIRTFMDIGSLNKR